MFIILGAHAMRHVDLTISDSDLQDMGYVIFMFQSLSFTVLEIFMSILFDDRIIFNVQEMLVYVLIGLLIYWNIYLQVMFRRKSNIRHDLLDNVTPSVPLKPIPPKIETRPNLRTKATLTQQIYLLNCLN